MTLPVVENEVQSGKTASTEYKGVPDPFVESLEESKCLQGDGISDTDFPKPIAKRWKSSPPYAKISRKIKEEICEVDLTKDI